MYEKKVNSWIANSILFLLVPLAAIYFIQDSKLAYIFIGGIISLIVKIIQTFVNDNKNKEYLIFINYSILIFILGGLCIYNIDIFEKTAGTNTGIVLISTVALIIFLMFITIVTLLIRFINSSEENDNLKIHIEEIKANKVSMIDGYIGHILNGNGLTKFGDLLKIMKDKEANVLTVTGNLLGLKTKEGCNLLMQFLKQDSTYIVHLVIPKKSEQYLNEIKKNIVDDNENILQQIKVSIYQKLWFLQGVVIFGNRDHEYPYEMNPAGFFYYKIKMTESDQTPDVGIYVDFGNDNVPKEYMEAVTAYYFLLECLEYEKHQYTVKKIFTMNEKPYDELIKIVNWNDIT